MTLFGPTVSRLNPGSGAGSSSVGFGAWSKSAAIRSGFPSARWNRSGLRAVFGPVHS